MRIEYFIPEVGEVYTLRSGGKYRCLAVENTEFAPVGDHVATLLREPDGWRLDAHGIWRNEDGTIEWKYSTGGRWTK